MKTGPEGTRGTPRRIAHAHDAIHAIDSRRRANFAGDRIARFQIAEHRLPRAAELRRLVGREGDDEPRAHATGVAAKGRLPRARAGLLTGLGRDALRARRRDARRPRDGDHAIVAPREAARAVRAFEPERCAGRAAAVARPHAVFDEPRRKTTALASGEGRERGEGERAPEDREDEACTTASARAHGAPNGCGISSR